MAMKTLAAAVTLCALSTTIAVAAREWVREPVRPGPVARDAALLRQVMLDGHNVARAAFGSAPLIWDEGLARNAGSYAEELARTDNFRHAIDQRGVGPQGETLWAGTRLDYNYTEMLDHWIREESDFRPGTVPDVSRTGRFADVAHYVQIVWPASRRLGCAMAGNDRVEYLVCRYGPRGNVIGTRLRSPP